MAFLTNFCASQRPKNVPGTARETPSWHPCTWECFPKSCSYLFQCRSTLLSHPEINRAAGTPDILGYPPFREPQKHRKSRRVHNCFGRPELQAGPYHVLSLCIYVPLDTSKYTEGLGSMPMMWEGGWHAFWSNCIQICVSGWVWPMCEMAQSSRLHISWSFMTFGTGTEPN